MITLPNFKSFVLRLKKISDIWLNYIFVVVFEENLVKNDVTISEYETVLLT